MSETSYVGGQAVIEGVMMRGKDSWAVAVRNLDGDIDIQVHDVAQHDGRWRKLPVLRGILALGESLVLGAKALMWASNRQVPEDEQLSGRTMAITTTISLIIAAGIFSVLPALASRGAASVIGLDGIAFHAFEGIVMLGIFLGYLWAVGHIAHVKRVFQYHGAEHKAIAAYENGVELTPVQAQKFSTEHVRCGTNFLLTVVVLAVVVYSFIGRPSIIVVIASRLILIPLIAGVAYEVIKGAAKHLDKAWVRFVMRPGLALQKLTTREPDLEQLEVALISLRAVLTAEQTAEVAQRGEQCEPTEVQRFLAGPATTAILTEYGVSIVEHVARTGEAVLVAREGIVVGELQRMGPSGIGAYAVVPAANISSDTTALLERVAKGESLALQTGDGSLCALVPYSSGTATGLGDPASPLTASELTSPVEVAGV